MSKEFNFKQFAICEHLCFYELWSPVYMPIQLYHIRLLCLFKKWGENSFLVLCHLEILAKNLKKNHSKSDFYITKISSSKYWIPGYDTELLFHYVNSVLLVFWKCSGSNKHNLTCERSLRHQYST